MTFKEKRYFRHLPCLLPSDPQYLSFSSVENQSLFRL
jgi:hypothetical protein